MKISIISKKLIKPRTPTPQNLKNYKISFIDQFRNNYNVTIVLFYQSKPKNNIPQLEESLARTLVEFYPLAGRYIKNDHLIDCSDQGVEFVEAEALDVELMNDLIAKNEMEHLKSLFTDRCYLANNQLLSIQVTHFPCGGLAIAISVSHTVFDGSSLATFIAAWSNATNLDNNQTVGSKITPSFDLPLLLPYKDIDFCFSSDESLMECKNMVVKRLLFDKVSVARLRSKLRPNRNGKRISRVRVVSAVIAKALIGVDDAKHGRRRKIFIGEAINMRGRTIPPQPLHACGNLLMSSSTHVVAESEEREIELQELVDQMSDALVKSMAEFAEILSPHRDGRDLILNDMQNLQKLMSDPDTNVIGFSDWSKFGLYEADFGWGKPIWTGIGPQILNESTAILMNNTEGDGIEAWVYLNQDDVWLFEQDEDIKRFIIT